MKLSKEQFRAQFKYGPVKFPDVQLTFDQTIHGYKIYRALQLLVLEDEGKFYVASGMRTVSQHKPTILDSGFIGKT